MIVNDTVKVYSWFLMCFIMIVYNRVKVKFVISEVD